MGRHPLPTKLKKIQGTHQACRDTPDEMEVDPLSSIPQAPDRLNEEGKKVWNRIVKVLEDIGILDELGLDLLESYCYQISVMRQAQEVIDTEGLIDQTTGKRNENIKIYNDALAQSITLAAKFGFDPSSRTRISAPGGKKKKDDDLDQFFKTG